MPMFDLQPNKDATIKNDVLSGLTVALALVPEAVAFAFVAISFFAFLGAAAVFPTRPVVSLLLSDTIPPFVRFSAGDAVFRIDFLVFPFLLKIAICHAPSLAGVC